jgi:hypothetical protein
MGILYKTNDGDLGELIQSLCPEHSVPILPREPNRDHPASIPPVDLRKASHAEVFDTLYPPISTGGVVGETQRQELRAEFVRRATEVVNKDGVRVGLAALGDDLTLAGLRDLSGIVLVNGLRADTYSFFTGYLEGKPNRASRDKAELAVERQELRDWLASQEVRMRELDVLDSSTRARLSQLFYRANHTLPTDFAVAFADGGLLTFAEVPVWAAARDEIVFPQGWPLGATVRPVRVIHLPTGKETGLPEGWIMEVPHVLHLPFNNVLGRAADEEFRAARLDRTNTWQRYWWYASGSVRGLVMKLICQAWKCEIGEILEPVEKRGWSDFADIGYEHIGQVPVYRLNRPRRV